MKICNKYKTIINNRLKWYNQMGIDSRTIAVIVPRLVSPTVRFAHLCFPQCTGVHAECGAVARPSTAPPTCVRFHAMRPTFNRTIFACLHTLGREFPCQWRILIAISNGCPRTAVACVTAIVFGVYTLVSRWRNYVRRTSGESGSQEYTQYHITIRNTADTRWSAPAPTPPVSWTAPAVSSAVVASTPAAASRPNICRRA